MPAINLSKGIQMDDAFFDRLNQMKGKEIRIQTPDAVYRGTCETIDSDTLSLLISDVEEMTLYGRPTEKAEEEWHDLCSLMMVHGDYVETVALEEDVM